MNKKPQVLLLAGKSKHGKTTIGKYLESKYLWKELAFADDLKSLVSRKEDIPLQYFYDQELKEKKMIDTDKTPRELLIEWANKIRKTDNAYFAKRAWHVISSSHTKNNDKPFVLTDCGYPVEIEYLKKHCDCVVVWINRPNQKSKVFDNRKLTEKDAQATVTNGGEKFNGVSIMNQLIPIIKRYLNTPFIIDLSCAFCDDDIDLSDRYMICKTGFGHNVKEFRGVVCDECIDTFGALDVTYLPLFEFNGTKHFKLLETFRKKINRKTTIL